MSDAMLEIHGNFTRKSVSEQLIYDYQLVLQIQTQSLEMPYLILRTLSRFLNLVE